MKSIISKTKIKLHISKKTNPNIAETIKTAIKHPAWLPIAKRLAGPARKYVSINLSDIEKKATVGDTFLVLGKVLSSGEVSKKIRVCALSFSQAAREKLMKTKSEAVSILEEIKINPKAQGLKVLQ
ncbi:MAG: 50S ribosomal protein L18e [Nanoarchaeota archaeon]